MFGLKWLWKSNKTKIDTSNFVSREFLSTTLQDYVLNNSLNTTLANYLTTNTAQTITGAKTFTEGIVINKNPVPLTLKATDNNKTYIVYKDSSNNSNFSLGANSGQTSIEVNRGDLLIQTQQQNKTVSFETGVIKTNRARVEFGTEINAGYGGGAVKFIPEDNSTKTLQFYNSAATDTRRFNLLVPEPTAAQNPATKNYVDNAIAGVSNANLQSQINELNTFKTSVENSYGYNIRFQDIQLQNNSWLGTETIGDFVNYITSIDTFRDVKFLSATIHFGNDYNFSINRYIMFSAAGRGDSNRVYLNILRLTNVSNSSPNFDNAYVRVFYIDNISARTEDPYFIVEEDN